MKLEILFIREEIGIEGEREREGGSMREKLLFGQLKAWSKNVNGVWK